jgi:hypothetical protein
MIPGVDIALATTAFSVANSLGASPKVMLSLFEAGLVESGMRNLNYGDRDSVGYLQQRPSQGWPDPMNVTTATKSYVTRAIRNDKANPHFTAGQLAQSVQRSAFPDRYDKREADAREVLADVQRRGGGTVLPLPGGGIGAPIPGGLPGAGDLVGTLADIGSAVKTMATGVVDVAGLAGQLAKLALPSNIVRAFAGGLGVILVFTGIIVIGKQVKA